MSAALALLLFAGCSPAAPAASPSPDTHAITVRIVDQVPLDVYWNYNDSECTAQEYMKPKVDRGPQVTIANGAGKVLASQDGPRIGGTAKIEASCTVDIPFASVPVSDVYVVTIKGHDGQTWDRTVQTSADSPQVIEVTV